MRFIALFLLLIITISAQAATYTLTWCPVMPVAPAKFVSYTVCVESTVPISDTCTGKQYITSNGTSLSFTYPDNKDAWIRVNASEMWWTWNPWQSHFLVSAWSNPIHIIGGLTPPSIGGCN